MDGRDEPGHDVERIDHYESWYNVHVRQLGVVNLLTKETVLPFAVLQSAGLHD